MCTLFFFFILFLTKFRILAICHFVWTIVYRVQRGDHGRNVPFARSWIGAKSTAWCQICTSYGMDPHRMPMFSKEQRGIAIRLINAGMRQAELSVNLICFV